MSVHFRVSEADRRPSESLGTDVSPSYQRQFGDEPYPIVGGRRLIPGDDPLSIQEVLRRQRPSRDGRWEVPRAH
jgi:hypothetical protein